MIMSFLWSFVTALVKKKSCPELPDLTFKGRVNPDTPISQSNITSMKTPSFVYHLLHPKNIAQKMQGTFGCQQ